MVFFDSMSRVNSYLKDEYARERSFDVEDIPFIAKELIGATGFYTLIYAGHRAWHGQSWIKPAAAGTTLLISYVITPLLFSSNQDV